ncbi:hypothetical protein NECAME_08098 [Necator americanus]|uniref:ILEI/PANDER domain-containing protein n=1 Tax=Necator americanus TaxID=51031 RepID=W2TKL9_NECAM|nr:hypothetical protein NECAME_08098 [Necator americanus]ETN82169.1 hypothetical protein NECAME_08098 [Necator americanus]
MRLNRRTILTVLFASSFVFLTKYVYSRFNGYPPESSNQDYVFSKTTHGTIGETVKHEGQCSYDPSCSSPQILFRIHAETANSPPFACLNDVRLFGEHELKNGVNLVSLNGSTGDIESSMSFDVAESDGELISWLMSLPLSSVIIGVSFGDVAERVSSDARTAFATFGASRIVNWRGASSYAILGQRGLKQHAHELLVPQSDDRAIHIIEGCYDVPLGEVGVVNITNELTDIQSTKPRIDPEKMAALGGSKNTDQIVKLGQEWKWCGMETPCAPGMTV